MLSKGLKEIFAFGRKDTLGLDIGSSSVKLVQLKEGRGGYTLVKTGMVPLPHEAIVDGSIIDASSVVQAIKDLIKDQKVKTKNVASSISGHSVIIKRVSLPVMTEEELADSIQWEAEQYIPFNIEDVNIDFQIIGADPEGKGQMEVLLVACKKEVVEDYVSVIREAGLNPVVLDIDAFTLENMFEINYPVPKGENIALVNIGASVTNINILSDGITSFTRDISVGGNRFTEEIQKALHLNFQDAEALKTGGEVEGRSRDEVRPILERAVDLIASEVKRTIDFFLSTASGEYVSRIYISGGASKSEGLLEAIVEKTGINTERINPFHNIECNRRRFKAEYLEDIAPFMAVAVGLALRRAGDK